LEARIRTIGRAFLATFQAAVFLAAFNLGLLWLLMAAPLGRRTIRVSRIIRERPEELWKITRPAGDLAAWHPNVIAVEPVDGKPDLIEFAYRHPDRHGQPSRRTLIVDRTAMTTGGSFSCDLRVVGDSTLDASFWDGYRESRKVERVPLGSRVTFEQTDNYRGLAFYLFRRMAVSRELTSLRDHVEERTASRLLHFEHPLWQTFLVIASTLLLWPFFGLTSGGLMMSVFLTLVILLHELGHMVAYRTFGHPSVRMIFVPLLGGIAIGGRPYNSHFEVATCALMGAGFSALLVPILVAVHQSLQGIPHPAGMDGPTLVFLVILSAFNLLNLLPTYRFDGGQVLRQIFENQRALAISSFVVTGVIVWTGWRIGLSAPMLIGGLAIFILLSMIRTKSIKPRDALLPMNAPERLMTGFGFYAALAMHAYALIYACDRLSL
jgi:Zn-dependent protease